MAPFVLAGGSTAARVTQWPSLAWLSGFTICLRDGVTNGNKCVSFMGNMWESSCPWLGDSAGVDCLGTVTGWWMPARVCAVRMCVGWDGAEWDEWLMIMRRPRCPRFSLSQWSLALQMCMRTVQWKQSGDTEATEDAGGGGGGEEI